MKRTKLGIGGVAVAAGLFLVITACSKSKSSSGGGTAAASTPNFTVSVLGYNTNAGTPNPYFVGGGVTAPNNVIDCGGPFPVNTGVHTTCAAAIAAGTQITLTAAPYSANCPGSKCQLSVFNGWGPPCSNSSLTCTLTVATNTVITALFCATHGNTGFGGNTNFVIPAGCPDISAALEVTTGNGGGGGASLQYNGGGGGSGARAEGNFILTSAASPYAIVAGGGAVSGGLGSTAVGTLVGGTGGDAAPGSFGNLISATGGKGGAGSTNSTPGVGGAGGLSSVPNNTGSYDGTAGAAGNFYPAGTNCNNNSNGNTGGCAPGGSGAGIPSNDAAFVNVTW